MLVFASMNTAHTIRIQSMHINMLLIIYSGNSWGECEDGSYAVGCGNQETFRGCSDIAISN